MTSQARFKLFANCILVNGANRSTICDLQRGDVHMLPNSFAELMSKEVIYAHSVLNEEAQACVDYLLQNDLAHYNEDDGEFPRMSLEFDFPGEVSHAIIEISERSDFDYAKLFSDLSDLGVKFLELRFYTAPSYTDLLLVNGFIKPTGIVGVNFYIKSNDLWTSELLNKILVLNQRINSIVIFSSKEENSSIIHNRRIIQTTKALTNKMCGKIHSNYFSCNIRTFTESQTQNNCLSRKLSISEDGTLKNCPSMSESFGNTKVENLAEVVRSKQFRRLWEISKDKIRVCQDCEFRYVCTDCRAYLDNPDDELSKPLKCGYDPYLNTWEEWSTNPLKQQTIKYYGFESTA